MYEGICLNYFDVLSLILEYCRVITGHPVYLGSKRFDRLDQLTDSEKGFQFGVGLLQVLDAIVETDLAVLGLVVALERRELALLEPAEREDDVGAEVWLDVFWHELADLRAVLGPVGVVAHDLHQNTNVNETIPDNVTFTVVWILSSLNPLVNLQP